MAMTDHRLELPSDRAALIGLGRRGCEHVRTLLRSIPGQEAKRSAFLIDHRSAARPNDPASEGIGPATSDDVPDFRCCELVGVVVVGAEHREASERRRLVLGLRNERPALLLGIVLPPPPGEPARLDPELLGELDCVACWPGDPARQEWGALLQVAVRDWVATVMVPSLFCIDISEVIALFCGVRQPLMVASASAALERPQTAVRSALAGLEARGFRAERATGLLAVVRTGFGLTVRHFEAVRDVLKGLPFSDEAGLAMASPVQVDLADTLRVTLFAAGPFAAPPWARAMGFDLAARS